MPSHKIHRLIDRLIIGKEYKHVHRVLDKPYKWLGKKHRVSRHNIPFVLLRFGLSEEFIAGCLHILADKVITGKTIKKKKRR